VPLFVRIAITHPNDAANVVELPVPPIADPVRPSGPPVDLHLEYRVLPGNGRTPTENEVNEMGVALRTRLDVSTRRVKLDVIGNKEIVITICHTTQPDADRRLIQARGELAVVPLPASDYGSTTRQGPRGLPAVGGQIDKALEPIAPPSRLGLTTAHVDPTNGQRGLAFMLSNDASEIFRTYAAAHRDEFVAVVLDGVVLAVLTIDDRTARGRFVFTGDYTEAESQSLARWLYRDPLPYDLEKTMDVEFASR
jgi:preprotein translocase subunit SecD